MKTEIPFAYLLPDGRKRDTTFPMEEEQAKTAQELIRMGYRFEVEILTTNEASLTVHDPRTKKDIATGTCLNGPAVVTAIKKLVAEAIAVARTRCGTDRKEKCAKITDSKQAFTATSVGRNQ